MDNDYNLINSVQRQNIFIVEYNVLNPFATIYEVLKNGTVVFAKTCKNLNGNKNSGDEEENEGDNIGKDKDDQSFVRIFVVYKNISDLDGSSRSASNGRGNSRLSNAKSSNSSLLLFGYSSSRNGDKIDTFTGMFAINDSNAQDGQRDNFTKNASPKNGKTAALNSICKITFTKHGDASYEIGVVSTSNNGGREITYIYDPNTLNRKLKPKYGSGDDNLEILLPKSDDVYGSDEVRSEQDNRNMKHDYNIDNSNLNLPYKNSTKTNDLENVCPGKILNMIDDTSTYDNGSDDINSETNNRNSNQKHGRDYFISEKNHINLGHGRDFARGNNGRVIFNTRKNSDNSQENQETFPSKFDQNFDGVEFFSDTDDMAFEKPDYESLAIFVMLLSRFAIIIEEYFENHGKDYKNSKLNERTRLHMVVVPSEVFEEAMRRCHIDTTELTYSYIYPSDCRMFVGVPIYRNGYIHRKDQL